MEAAELAAVWDECAQLCKNEAGQCWGRHYAHSAEPCIISESVSLGPPWSMNAHSDDAVLPLPSNAFACVAGATTLGACGSGKWMWNNQGFTLSMPPCSLFMCLASA